jgi:hypothetical protein
MPRPWKGNRYVRKSGAALVTTVVPRGRQSSGQIPVNHIPANPVTRDGWLVPSLQSATACTVSPIWNQDDVEPPPHPG